MSPAFLLYGANGFTGRLILQRALEMGLRPMLAGRNAAQIAALAEPHDLEHRAFPLDDTTALDGAVGAAGTVVHAAGPFAHTAAPMAAACLRQRAHYIDITGEIDVLVALHALDAHARDAGVMLLPGAGFDVVPTDLLAAHLKQQLPHATHLRLAFHSPGGRLSRGTALTMVENIARGGAVRRAGRIMRVPAAWRTRTVDFGFDTRPVDVTTIPWGDVATAYWSTGIPDIEVSTSMGAGPRVLLKASRYIGGLLASGPVQSALKSVVRSRVKGPDESLRRHGSVLLWGEVEDESGATVVARQRVPEGYRFTAMTAVEIVRRVLAGDAPAGYRTPSLAYGPDWILGMEGVERQSGARVAE